MDTVTLSTLCPVDTVHRASPCLRWLLWTAWAHVKQCTEPVQTGLDVGFCSACQVARSKSQVKKKVMKKTKKLHIRHVKNGVQLLNNMVHHSVEAEEAATRHQV